MILTTQATKSFRGIALSTFLLLLAWTNPAVASDLALKVSKVTAGGSDITAIISTDNCDALGALQFELTYDPAVVEAKSVVPGSALSNIMIDFNVKKPGLLGIAIVSSEPFSGTGELLEVRFKQTGAAGTSTKLVITHCMAWDHGNSQQMSITTEEGSVSFAPANKPAPAGTDKEPSSGDKKDDDSSSMILLLIVGGLVLVVVIIMVMISKMAKKTNPVAQAYESPAETQGGFCENCGQELNTETRFCPKCGQVTNN
ncbi:MAG TPA: hypothetical protein ENL03_03055 [Phycisphaerae bacterium]|nr:hypothetical protein [Phycisphaerae bacterium]